MMEARAAQEGFDSLESFLRRHYLENNTPVKRIAYNCGVSDTMIYRMLHKLGIQRRKDRGKEKWRKSFDVFFPRKASG